jgi:heme oxygenase
MKNSNNKIVKRKTLLPDHQQITLPTYLKKATASRHQELDARVNLDFQAPQAVIRQTYLQLLQATYRFITALEPSIHAYLKEHALQPWSLSCDRQPTLIQDLQELQAEIPNPEPGVTIVSLPQALGSLYVVEGSALGGRVIYKQLKQIPAIADQCSFHYHGVPAEQLSKRWRDIQRVLSTSLKEPDFALAGDAANAAFSLFEGYL